MIETVELHFEGGSLPVLTRWFMRWRQIPGSDGEITAVAAGAPGPGRRFHWNLPLMSLCLALLRLEAGRGGASCLLRSGARSSAAAVLADSCADTSGAGRLLPVLARPGNNDAQDVHERLNRWFRVTRGPRHQNRPAEIWCGPCPPDRIIVTVDGETLDLEDFPMLESKLVWMSEERDWLGSVLGMAPAASVA